MEKRYTFELKNCYQQTRFFADAQNDKNGILLKLKTQ